MPSYKTQLLSPSGWRQCLSDETPKRELSIKTLSHRGRGYVLTISACRNGWRDVWVEAGDSCVHLAVCQRQRGLAAVSAFQTYLGGE